MITFVIGGSGSGKSEYAESIITGYEPGKRYYIATMQAFDDEAREKIKRHRRMRSSKGFETVECQTNLPGAQIEPGADVLLECISNLVANEMFDPKGAREDTISSVLEGIDRLREISRNLVIVSNNVFGEGDSYTAETRKYVGNIAKINGKIAQRADAVYEVVFGIPLKLK